MTNNPKVIPFFETKDQVTSILLYALGYKLDSHEWRGNTCFFVFEDREKCEEAVAKHLRGEISINSKAFFDSFATIKGIIFANRGY